MHPSGEIIVVKRLKKTIRGGERQFRNTVGDLLALEHKNVAKLIGCCYGVEREAAACNRGSLLAYKQDNFLCYEYLRGESLDKCIYGMAMTQQMTPLALSISQIKVTNSNLFLI